VRRSERSACFGLLYPDRRTLVLDRRTLVLDRRTPHHRPVGPL